MESMPTARAARTAASNVALTGVRCCLAWTSAPDRVEPPTPGGSSRLGWRHGEWQLPGAAAHSRSRPVPAARQGQLRGWPARLQIIHSASLLCVPRRHSPLSNHVAPAVCPQHRSLRAQTLTVISCPATAQVARRPPGDCMLPHSLKSNQGRLPWQSGTQSQEFSQRFW